jgi:hypothetical protein
MPRNHGASIKDDAQYEALRDTGMSKEKAARIANTGREAAARRGGSHPPYEDWTVRALYAQAKKIGIGNRSRMNKRALVDALRRH